jgi:hypothetical protein
MVEEFFRTAMMPSAWSGMVARKSAARVDFFMDYQRAG